MTYLESEMISSGKKIGTSWMATIVVASSPIWFDWAGPGTLKARFHGSLWPNHMPLLHFAFIFLLLVHALLVNTLVFWCLLSASFLWCWAGNFDIFSGSVKIWKHLVMLFLLVMVRSKTIDPFSCFALRLSAFLHLIRERLSWCSFGFSGFSLGIVILILVKASSVQLCGCMQPLVLSSLHAVQLQKLVGLCWFPGASFILADVMSRSAIVLVLCLCRRHLAFWLFIGWCSAPVWNQAGRLCFSSGDSLITVRLAL